MADRVGHGDRPLPVRPRARARRDLLRPDGRDQLIAPAIDARRAGAHRQFQVHRLRPADPGVPPLSRLLDQPELVGRVPAVRRGRRAARRLDRLSRGRADAGPAHRVVRGPAPGVRLALLPLNLATRRQDATLLKRWPATMRRGGVRSRRMPCWPRAASRWWHARTKPLIPYSADTPPLVLVPAAQAGRAGQARRAFARSTARCWRRGRARCPTTGPATKR